MTIRIGTRKSRLALVQTEMVCSALKNKFPEIKTEIVPITTKGDKILDKPLTQIGGKGIFITEIEQALRQKKIDIAVHSAKDLPVEIPEDLAVSAVLKRGDPRDVMVTRAGENIRDEKSFTVGTGSVRRKMFIRKMYPQVSVSDIRGNVDTRIKKLLDGNCDALILAAAGLERLGIKDDNIAVFTLDIDKCLPAPCQGIIAIESRKNDSAVCGYLSSINDTDTFLAFETERYILKLTGGNCDLPLGAYGYISENKIFLTLSDKAETAVKGCAPVEERFRLAERLVKEL